MLICFSVWSVVHYVLLRTLRQHSHLLLLHFKSEITNFYSVIQCHITSVEWQLHEVCVCLHGRGKFCAMGRLGGSNKSSSTNAARPLFRVHYRKLVDDCGDSKDSLSFVPPLPDYLSYCCCQCGHTQKLKVRQGCNSRIACSCQRYRWLDIEMNDCL
jgi:hypothetical protein